MTEENDIEYFFSHVKEMMNAVDNWNPPPLIIEYKDDGSFYVCDGRYRLEMFRQKKRSLLLLLCGQREKKILIDYRRL